MTPHDQTQQLREALQGLIDFIEIDNIKVDKDALYIARQALAAQAAPTLKCLLCNDTGKHSEIFAGFVPEGYIPKMVTCGCKAVQALPKHKPLMRLTGNEIWSDDGIMSVNADLGLTFDELSRLINAVMDAMEHVNK